MSYTNYSRNKYRNLCRPICPINVIVQDDNIKKPKPIPHLYYPNYPYSGYPPILSALVTAVAVVVDLVTEATEVIVEQT